MWTLSQNHTISSPKPTSFNSKTKFNSTFHLLLLHLSLLHFPLLSPFSTFKKSCNSIFTKRLLTPSKLMLLRRRKLIKRTLEHMGGYYGVNVEETKQKVPKGHMVVCVGGIGEEVRRVFVPVVYFNHPLFKDLLNEAEEMYGHHHHGCITFPCHFSEFELLKTRVAALHGRRNAFLKHQRPCKSR